MVAMNGVHSTDEEHRVWLAHKGGYALAELQGPAGGDSKVRIRIEATGAEMVVDSDDIEKVCLSLMHDSQFVVYTPNFYES
jgi:hypothetical protein